MQTRRFSAQHNSSKAPPQQRLAGDHGDEGASSSSSSALEFRTFSPVPQENLAEMSTSGHVMAHSTPLPPSNQLVAMMGPVAEVPAYSQPDPFFYPVATIDPSEVRSSQAVDLIRV